jgi:hypothetical protein
VDLKRIVPFETVDSIMVDRKWMLMMLSADGCMSR